jgi:hypothetical protein
MNTITLNSNICQFIIYPKGGLVANGVVFVTAIHNISGTKRPTKGDTIPSTDILHTWWRSLTIDEVKSMYGDGITFDKVCEKLTVFQL